ncbi:MAG: CoA transferase [Actinomycetota bacterium]|nr:CoA transferase [Actinomycetota bacterium]
MSGALDGIVIIDVSTLVQGPQAASMLHGLGAEVIKVELPGAGDVGRHVAVIPDWGGPVFIAHNRGKRSITLDLRTPSGKAALERMCASADVLLSNFMPGTLEGWGLSYDHLATINPRLIWAAASYLGPHGPDARREGADMAGQAMGGIISTTGSDGGPMTPIGALIADSTGAQNLTTGILAALFAREKTGRGQRVDVSLLGGQMWLQSTELTYYLITGETAGRSNAGHPLVDALYGIFPTVDGFIAIAGCPEHLWPGMVRAVERPDLLDNPRFGTYFTTPEIRAELFVTFNEIFATRTTAEWCERLAAEGQRFAPVRSHSEVADDPQAAANGYVVAVDHPDHGSVRVVGNPITMTDTPTRTGISAPELGQHTEEILLELGYTWDDIARFGEESAI